MGQAMEKRKPRPLLVGCRPEESVRESRTRQFPEKLKMNYQNAPGCVYAKERKSVL